jgi:signal transduction histidine kinase
VHTHGEGLLPPDVQVAIYRVAQEAINNIIKHARATHARIEWHNDGHRATLTITDDGVGFTTGVLRERTFGTRIMRERAERIGARFDIQSQPMQGTRVELVWEQR